MSRDDSTERFGERVHDYELARPGYPIEVVLSLEERWSLRPGSAIADVGSGTGLFSADWLSRGHDVFAVEPNRAMAVSAARRFEGNTGFHDVRGRAECTGLPPRSVDLVVAAQAFHWFDSSRAHREFLRILRPPAPVALLWNLRRVEAGEFDRSYEAFLDHWGGDEYHRIQDGHGRVERIAEWFGRAPEPHRFEHVQRLDRVGFEARVLSCSYLPARDDPIFPSMREAVVELFEAHADAGRVDMHYETVCFSDVLGRAP
jgi:SAM-dependent methyltransferase